VALSTEDKILIKAQTEERLLGKETHSWISLQNQDLSGLSYIYVRPHAQWRGGMAAGQSIRENIESVQ